MKASTRMSFSHGFSLPIDHQIIRKVGVSTTLKGPDGIVENYALKFEMEAKVVKPMNDS